MDKKKKSECDNQWATSNMFLTSKAEVKEKMREIMNGHQH